MDFDRKLLVGCWYRTEINSEELHETEYAELSVDGCYEFSFTVQSKSGEVIQQSIEVGDWGLVGDIHFTIAKNEVFEQEYFAVDLANPDNYHAYKVLELNSQTFKYQHIVSNEVFILKRVIDKIAHC